MRPASLSSKDPLIGSTVAGRYHIEACIGAGAMGAVYRAQQAGLGRAVALKVLKRDLAWGGDTVQRFRREAKAMSALNHPHTVRVFDFGATDDGLLFLAMEMLEGEPVTDRLARVTALGVREAVEYAQQVLRSVGEAHAKGIVHRDLKPDNIFLAHATGAAPLVKVLDFGIAKAIEGERKIDQFETLDGTVFGTPRYMAPEQAAGKALDPRTDLYAVGILLYEFLTGHPPFVDSDAVVVMAKHIRETPLPVCKVAPERPIPRSLEAVVSKALEKDPALRFQSADAFDKALSDCLADIERIERLPIRVSHHSLIGRALTVPAPTRIWITIGAGALTLLGAALYEGLHSTPVRAPVAAVPETDSDRDPSLQPEQKTQTAIATTPTPVQDQPTTKPPATPSVVTLQSDPPGAEVWRGKTQLGVTPLDVVVKDGTEALSLRKRGYVDHTVELTGSDAQRTVVLSPTAAPPVSRPAAHATSDSRSRARPRAKGQTAAPASETPRATSPYEKF